MIYVCEYDWTISQPLLLEAAERLPLERSVRSQTGIKWEKLRERILGWLLLEYAVRREYSLSLDDLNIIRGAHGKPLSRSDPPIWFNISHCCEGCACVIAGAPCGIDIERKFPWRESLAKRITHEAEWDRMQTMEQPARTDALHRLWSLKESFVKQNGRGIGYGLDRINLSAVLKEPSDQVLFEDQGLHYFLFSGETYTVAACAAEPFLTQAQIKEPSFTQFRAKTSHFTSQPCAENALPGIVRQMLEQDLLHI